MSDRHDKGVFWNQPNQQYMIITDFENEDYLEVPSHTQEALDHYFVRGWEPGGFVMALLAKDYERALDNCDQVNKHSYVDTASWINKYAPKGSFGSYDIIEDWLEDKDGIQSTHKLKAERAFTWRTLSGEVE